MMIVFIHSYLERGKPEEGYILFEKEALSWPGFVEFDDVNGKIITYSAKNKYELLIQ